MAGNSWALRVAKQRRECDSCGGWILVDERYFRSLDSGEFWCCECPPEGADDVCERT